MSAFFHQVPNGNVDAGRPGPGGRLHGQAVRGGGRVPRRRATHDRMAAAVKAAGAEWSEPMYFQYENIGWGGNRISTGFDILRDRWQHARDNGSTLIQFVTWNDYTENTCLAPAYDTRYAVLDLNAWFVQWWKTGQEPTPDHDRVYFSYRKYPQGAKLFPFQPKQGDAGGVLEVLTILTAPARSACRAATPQWDAPAGMCCRQFPLTPGPVSPKLSASGNVVLRLESPEPITDRPFRETERDDLLLDRVPAPLEGRLRRRPAAAPRRVRRRRPRRPAQLVRDVLVRQVPGLVHRHGGRPQGPGQRRQDQPAALPGSDGPGGLASDGPLNKQPAKKTR